MADWLATFAAALDERAGGSGAVAGVPQELADALLALAKTVADGTGQRTNAPLSCYLAGRLASALAGEGVPAEDAAAEAHDIARRLLESRA